MLDLQDGCHGGHLGYLIRTFLANTDLQVELMLTSKFQVNWPFGLEEKTKNKFLRWPPCTSWISDQRHF